MIPKIVLDFELPNATNFLVTRVNKKDIVNSLPSDLTVINANGTSKASYLGNGGIKSGGPIYTNISPLYS